MARFPNVLFGTLGVVWFCVRCMPDLDALSSEQGGAGGMGQHGGESGTAGVGGDRGGSGSNNGGTGKGGSGGTTAGTGEGGNGGSTQGGESGAADGGIGGTTGGEGGTNSTGGTTSNGGTTSTGGTMGDGGDAGMGSTLPCVDGCALIQIPPVANFTQFITININLNGGVDLSGSVVTAHVRAIDFTGTTENIQLYASATGFVFWGNNGATVPLSALASGGVLTMDLTNTPGWDSVHTISVGFLLHGSAAPTTVQVLVEHVTVAVKSDPQAMPAAGPWLFTRATDVNDTAAEVVPPGYSTPDVIFANPFNPAPGTKVIWVASATQ